MKKAMIAYDRNPHVVRKLIRFGGYIPANLIDKAKKKITPVKFCLNRQSDFVTAKENNNPIDIFFDNQTYHTKVRQICMDDNKDIEEIELEIVG